MDNQTQPGNSSKAARCDHKHKRQPLSNYQFTMEWILRASAALLFFVFASLLFFPDLRSPIAEYIHAAACR